MISDALAGQFQVIVVLSFDRLFRNLEDSVVYKSLLRRDGIQVVSVMEPIDELSPLGFIHEGIIDLFSAYYSINLSTKIKGGLFDAVKNGVWPHRPPIGYIKAGDWIDISEAGALIKRAFNEFATGKYTLGTWSDRAYYQLGIRSPSGGRLRVSDWSRIFRNKFYIGVLQWSGIEAHGRHEPLVDDAVFETVQRVLLANNANKRPKVYRFYLLRGLVWSVDADGVMSGVIGKEYRYYRSRRKTPTGKRHHVRADLLESKIDEALQSVVLDITSSDTLSSELDEAMLLALRVSPNVGVLYRHLNTDEQRQALLKLVVNRYGFQISGHNIVSVDVKPPFCYAVDGLVNNRVGLTRVEPTPTYFYLVGVT
jgi:hypothetical protein